MHGSHSTCTMAKRNGSNSIRKCMCSEQWKICIYALQPTLSCRPLLLPTSPTIRRTRKHPWQGQVSVVLLTNTFRTHQCASDALRWFLICPKLASDRSNRQVQSLTMIFECWRKAFDRSGICQLACRATKHVLSWILAARRTLPPTSSTSAAPTPASTTSTKAVIVTSTMTSVPTTSGASGAAMSVIISTVAAFL